jgi:hypothetical protein
MKKALLIGIDYIDVSGISLNGCINDAINMRNMLIDAYDYEPKNIVMLRDDDADKFPSPTNDNIVYSIIDLVIESATLDEVWLHYSGHGSQIQSLECDSEKSKGLRKLLRSETYLKSCDFNDKNCINRDMMQILIPVDYKTNGCIVDKDLYDMVRRIKCRAILTFDCCHSGTVCDLPWTTEYQVPRTIQDLNNIVLEPDDSHKVNQLGMLVTTKISDAHITNPNIFMFSGCRDDQTSVDTINGMDQRSGAFTNALCECLRASHHNTGILSLHKDICIYLLERGYEQIPVLSSTVETPNHIFTKGLSLENIANLTLKPVVSANISFLEKTEKLSDEQAAVFQGYGRNHLTLHDNLVGQGLLHQYKNPMVDIFMKHNEGKFTRHPQPIDWHPPPPTTYSKDDTRHPEHLLPAISSGNSISTVSSHSSGLSSLYRHFYKRKTDKL